MCLLTDLFFCAHVVLCNMDDQQEPINDRDELQLLDTKFESHDQLINVVRGFHAHQGYILSIKSS